MSLTEITRYVCTVCGHKTEAREQVSRCGKCNATGEPRDFPSVETDMIAKQNDRFRAALLTSLPEGMKGQLVCTPGISERGREFITQCILMTARSKNFSEDNDPIGERDFGAITVQDERVW